MKKIVLFFSIFMLCAAPVLAGDLYVRSMRAKVLSKPSMKSKTIGLVKRGAILKEVKKRGKWIEVKFQDKKSWKTGWISKYLVSQKKPLKRISLLAKGDNIAKSSRRRASAFTSVAAARGLSDEARARKGIKSYTVDFDALARMEAIKITEIEAMQFIEEGVAR